MKSKTSVALYYGYYEIMRFIVFNNHRLIDTSNTHLDIWDYVLENYERLQTKV